MANASLCWRVTVTHDNGTVRVFRVAGALTADAARDALAAAEAAMPRRLIDAADVAPIPAFKL